MNTRAYQNSLSFREKYLENGLVKGLVRLPRSLVSNMRESLDRLMHDNPDIPPESLICPHIPYGQNHNSSSAKLWFDYINHPDLLDMVELLIGPNIVLWGSQVFYKPASVGKGVPWHQDGQYWPISPLVTCSVWVALDGTNSENGCMRYIPGSHRERKIFPHQIELNKNSVLGEEIFIDSKDLNDAKDNVLQPGEVSLHDAFLIHGSNPNKSNKRRAGFVIRYMPSSSVFMRSSSRKTQSGVSFDMNTRPIWLVRGKNENSENDYEIGHCENYLLAPE